MEARLDNSYNSKKKLRDLDKVLGEQYRSDPRATGLTFTQYKEQWKEAIRLKQLKIRYSPFEPMPDESAEEFKKRMRTETILSPVETEEEFQKRIGNAFHKGGG